MSLMTLKFGNDVAGINIRDIKDNNDIDLTFRKMFAGLELKDDLVTIDKLVELLKNNNWYISSKNEYPTGYEDINPDKYVDYIFNSSDRQIKLHLLFPNECVREEFKNNYNMALKELIELSKNAMVINDKYSQPNDNYQSKNNSRYRGKNYMPTIRKVFNNKKVKIALCTLGAAVTIVLGSVVVNSIAVMADAQETLNNSQQYSSKNANSYNYTNNDRQLHQAIQNGQYDAFEANPNGQAERNKIEYNQINYQGEQNTQNVR